MTGHEANSVREKERERERERERKRERKRKIDREYQEAHCSVQLKLDRRLLLPPPAVVREWFRFVTDSVRDCFVERKSRIHISHQDLIFAPLGRGKGRQEDFKRCRGMQED